MHEEIPDKNIFMMCKSLNESALSNLAKEFDVRNCREDELRIWKQMPFDNPEEAKEYESFMDDYFKTVYSVQEELFFQKTLFVCNQADEPIATCLLWKAYKEFNTIHWLKVKKEYEGLGIGRALLSIIMRNLPKQDYPVYLHTQPGSYRAIKLYSDFGFKLLTDDWIGNRKNEIGECLPILKKCMPAKDYNNLQTINAPSYFLERLKEVDTIEF